MPLLHGGTCKFGDQCNYYHPPGGQQGQQGQQGNNQGGGGGGGNRSQSPNKKKGGKGGKGKNPAAPAPEQPEVKASENRKAGVCYLILKGGCKFGDNCRFSHHPEVIAEAKAAKRS